MKLKNVKLHYFAPLIAAVAATHFAFAEDEDKPVKFEALPPAVAAAIEKAAGAAKLEKITSGDEDGTQAYEAVWKADGRKHEITVGKDGNVMGLEEVIPFQDAPAAVREAITKEAAGQNVKSVEKVMEKGKLSYEVTFKKGGAKTEVSFDETGKLLGTEDSSAEKEKKD